MYERVCFDIVMPCVSGGYQYSCVVCGRPLHSSAELVQHLIQHCDENTALKRQPQVRAQIMNITLYMLHLTGVYTIKAIVI